MPKLKKQYFVLVERDEELRITDVRVFNDEIAVWAAYETSNAEYATVHVSSAERSKRISAAGSEALNSSLIFAEKEGF